VSDTALDPAESWAARGYFRVDGFADAATCTAIHEEVVQVCRRGAAGDDIAPAFLAPEAQDLGPRPNPEDLMSKVFRLHHGAVFHEFAARADVVDLVAEIVGPDVDCFLSQFIFKNPGAWGRPWHQDSFYFPFEPARPVVGVWLAVTEATLENGCLHVLPGSHTEPVHRHVVDRRPGANAGYFEIIDHDTSGSEAVMMQPGDLLVFDSHLMHRSTDNESIGIRAAMVYHYAAAGTVDRSQELYGYCINDWMPVRRASR
jgi:phytanoyl-CoA hydroxylase